LATPLFTQARLVEMVAGRLLDAGSAEAARGWSAERAASVQQDLSDAIALLPQLCTGIDVNLRFHDVRGFEYTRETVSRCRDRAASTSAKANLAAAEPSAWHLAVEGGAHPEQRTVCCQSRTSSQQWTIECCHHRATFYTSCPPCRRSLTC
jgi:hypothetical protein